MLDDKELDAMVDEGQVQFSIAPQDAAADADGRPEI
jgi:hypothetical protein